MLFRAYFNRRQDAPLVWSVDAGTQETERHVAAFFADGCRMRSRYNGEPANEDTPVAWLEIEAARMEIAGGVAKFTHHPTDEDLSAGTPETVHEGCG